MTEIIITPVLFLTIGFMFWVLVAEMGRRSRLKALITFRMRLLDRLTSAADIVAVLASDQGAALLRDADDPPSWTGFNGRVLVPVQIGIVLFFVGAGFGSLAVLGAFEAREIFTAVAIMAAFVGGGFLISALAAWRLGLRSGLIPARDTMAEAPLEH